MIRGQEQVPVWDVVRERTLTDPDRPYQMRIGMTAAVNPATANPLHWRGSTA